MSGISSRGPPSSAPSKKSAMDIDPPADGATSGATVNVSGACQCQPSLGQNLASINHRLDSMEVLMQRMYNMMQWRWKDDGNGQVGGAGAVGGADGGPVATAGKHVTVTLINYC